MDRGAWQATIHGVTESRIQLRRLNMHSRLTMLWWFQVDSGGTQWYIYMYPFSPKLLSHPGCPRILSLSSFSKSSGSRRTGNLCLLHILPHWAQSDEGSVGSVKSEFTSWHSPYKPSQVQHGLLSQLLRSKGHQGWRFIQSHMLSNHANCVSSQWSSQSLTGQAWFWLFLTSQIETLGVFLGTCSQSQGCQVVNSSV